MKWLRSQSINAKAAIGVLLWFAEMGALTFGVYWLFQNYPTAQQGLSPILGGWSGYVIMLIVGWVVFELNLMLLKDPEPRLKGLNSPR